MPVDINALRRRLGLSQEELAQALGLAQPAISKLEMGAREQKGPVLKLLEAIERGDIKVTR